MSHLAQSFWISSWIEWYLSQTYTADLLAKSGRRFELIFFQIRQVDQYVFCSPIYIGMLKFSSGEDMNGVTFSHEPYIKYMKCFFVHFLILTTFVVVQKITQIS